MNEKLMNLTLRTLSGAVLVAVMLWAAVWSYESFGLMLLLLVVGGMIEFFALLRKQGDRPLRLWGVVTGAVLLLLCWSLATGRINLSEGLPLPFLLGAGWLLLFVPAMFVRELFRPQPHPGAAIGATLAGIFYVAMPLAAMCFIPVVCCGGVWNPHVMWAYFAIIWANDVFAYLFGMTLGRHRLCERLSPKKSWEGFFGGVAGAVAVGVCAARLLQADVWLWVGFSLVASVTGVLGDLVESMFKRAAGVKDSGRIIPGHGGVLDRFDAMLLSAPFVLVYGLFAML